jgi:WD40 repeat protein
MCRLCKICRLECLLLLALQLVTQCSDSLCLWQAKGIDSSHWSSIFALESENAFPNISTLAWSPESPKVAIAGGDSASVGILQLADSRWKGPYALERTLERTALAWSSHGDMLGIGRGDGYVHIWDISGKDPIHWKEKFQIQPEGQRGHVTALSWSPDATQIMYSLSSGAIIVWSIQQHQKIMDIDVLSQIGRGSLPVGNGSLVNSFAWSPETKRLVVGGNRGVSLWGVADNQGNLLETLDRVDHPACISSVAWSPDSDMIVDGSCTGLVRVWKVGKSSSDGFSHPYKIREIRHPYSVSSVSWSLDNRLAFGGGGSMSVWDVSALGNYCGWHLLRSLGGSNAQLSSIDSLSWSHDSTTLAFSGNNLVCSAPMPATTTPAATTTAPTTPEPPVHRIVRIAHRTAYVTAVSAWSIWAVLASIIFIMMVCGAGFAARKHTSTPALVLLIAIVVVILVALVYAFIKTLGLVPILGDYARYLVPQILPGAFYVATNLIGFFANILQWICHTFLAARDWSKDVCDFVKELCHLSRIYSMLSPTKQLAFGARSIEPLLEKRLNIDSFETVELSATSIRETVVEGADLGFASPAAYYRMNTILKEEQSVTVKDILGFLRGYICSLAVVIPKSFKRRVWMGKALRTIKHQQTNAEDQMHYRWFVMVDQCEWYLRHDMCLVDILVCLLETDEGARAAPVLRLWAAVDYGMSFAPQLLFRPLWEPSPDKRARDLTNRLRMLDHLAAGGLASSQVC